VKINHIALPPSVYREAIAPGMFKSLLFSGSTTLSQNSGDLPKFFYTYIKKILLEINRETVEKT